MNKPTKWTLIGCGSVFGLFLLMAACVAVIAGDTEPALAIEMQDRFEADKNGVVEITGKTTPKEAIGLYKDGKWQDGASADDNGNFSIKLMVRPNTEDEYFVVVERDGEKVSKKIVVVGPQEEAVDPIERAKTVIQNVSLAGASLKEVEVKPHKEIPDGLFATIIFEQRVTSPDCGNIRLNISKYLNQVFPEVENLAEIEVKGQVNGSNKAWLRTTRIVYENVSKANNGHISSADVHFDFPGGYGHHSSCGE